MLNPRKKKRKTGTQVIQDLGKSVAIKMKDLSRHDLTLNIICGTCIVIFSFSIGFGIYGLVSCLNDISKKERNLEKIKTELTSLEKQLEENKELKIKLVNDPLTIEAIARSYGMSRKGERIFYFLD